MTDLADLLPCPHCGERLTLRGGVNSYGRHPKSDCIGARMPVVNIPDDVHAWNTRAAPPDTKADPLRDDRILRDLDTLARSSDTGNRWEGEVADRAAAEIKRLRAAAPPAAPLREAAPEPVAWTVLSTDADRIRIWWRDKELAEKWAAEHSLPLIPLYAKPFAAADFLALASAAPAIQIQARKPEGGDWIDIYPAQLERMSRDGNDVRAVEQAAAPLRDDEDWNIRKYVDFLRADEGDSVTILSDNPDFNGQPNCAIECNGYWTSWQDRRFTGDTILVALSVAYIECMQWRAALAHGRDDATLASAPQLAATSGAANPVAWRRVRNDGVVTFWEKEVPDAQPLYALASAPQPAAPLRERDEMAQIIYDVFPLQHGMTFAKRAADAILSAVPQERVDRAAVIDDLVKALENLANATFASGLTADNTVAWTAALSALANSKGDGDNG